MLYQNEVINGTYQIIREIGHGGTGIVYLAYHKNLKKQIVLKRITHGIKNLEALRRETDILKNLHHFALPQIYDFVVWNGDVFTVMDYIEGTPLNQLAQGANVFPEKQLQKWLRELAEVLAYIHGQNPPVIHSDIKPENVILTPQNRLVLIDFNISLTENAPGKVVGFSRAYASPEQAYLAELIKNGMQGGYALDARTDIYSLGALFYYLICGNKPDCFQVTPKLNGRPGLIYTPAFLAVIDRCTQWEREKRYPSAKKMLSDLEHLHRMEPRYRMYVLWRSVSVLLCAALIAGGGYCLFHGMQKKVEDAYGRDYAAFSNAVEAGDAELVIGSAQKLLNERDYRRILKKNISDQAYIDYAIGQAVFQNGDYTEATEYYEAALSVLTEQADTKAIQLKNNIRMDEIIALAQMGDLEKAQDMLEIIGEDGTDSDLYRLMQLSLALEQDDKTLADTLYRQIASDEERDIALHVRACVLEAEHAKKQNASESQLVWLAYIPELSERAEDLRYCAYQTLLLAQTDALPIELRSRAADYARRFYQMLLRTDDAHAVDHMNYALLLRLYGNHNESMEELLLAYEAFRKTEDSHSLFRVCAYLSLTCEEAGNTPQADKYRQEADQWYSAMKEADDAEQALHEMLGN